MLDIRAAQTAIDLTLETSSKGIMLAAVPDTPLALLCRQSPLELTDRREDTLSAAAEEMVNMTRGEEHAGVLTSVVSMAAESVRRTLDLARNTTMPHIRRVIGLFDEYVSNEAQARSPYNVLPSYLPDVFKTDTAERLLSGYGAILPQSVDGNPFFGKFSPDEIRELVRVTNDGEFNELIDELLMSDNGKVLAEVAAGLEGLLNVKRISPEAALPLLIVLKNIETPKEGVAVSLSKYNADREIFAANVGKIAATQVARVTQSTATSALYPIVADDSPTNIRVNGEAYSKLLARGLSVEAVIGNELLGRKFRGELMVTEEALKEMMGAYNRDKAIRQQAHEVRKQQVIRKGVLESLRSDHAYVTGEGNAMQVAGDTADTSWIRLREFVDGVYSGHAQGTEPAIIIAAAVCNVWYGHTDAGRVIAAMMSVEKANPALEPREVATLATLRYISDWVASQIAVVQAD